MKLFLGIFTTCMMINLSGMELSSTINPQNKKLTLRNAMELVGSGKGLVVYYNDAEKPTKDYSTQIIKDFRTNQSLREHITDYVVNGPLQYESKPDNNWSDVPTSIAAIVSTKKGSGFYPCGFVVYTTQSNELFAFNRYMNHLQSLQKACVSVIMYAHSKEMAEKIFYQSSIDSSRKNLIVNGSLISVQPEWTKLVPIIMASYVCGTGILFGLFCLISCDLKNVNK